MIVKVMYIKNGLAVYEESNGDCGIISLYGGCTVEVGDILNVLDKSAINMKNGKDTKIYIEEKGMYLMDAIAIVDKN